MATQLKSQCDALGPTRPRRRRRYLLQHSIMGHQPGTDRQTRLVAAATSHPRPGPSQFFLAALESFKLPGAFGRELLLQSRGIVKPKQHHPNQFHFLQHVLRQ